MANYNVNITITGKDSASPAIGNVNSALSTLAGVAGGMALYNALRQTADGVMTIAKSSVGAAASMQTFRLSIETLAAREAVRKGLAENVTEALKEIGPAADDITEKLKNLSLVSPFTFQTIQDTFRTQMAFGQTADMSIKLTSAIMDTAAALGLSGEATDRLAYNFAQINSVGKLMAVDLRQLRMVGLDLADVMESQLNMSIEEVNAALETGKLTMKDVSEAFINYSEVNFAGAAQRLSLTAQGIQSSFEDLFYFLSTDLLGDALQTVTSYLQDFFFTARDLQASGYFAALGDEVDANVKRIMAVLEDMLGAKGPEEVIKKIGDAVVTASGKIADTLEWWNSLNDDVKSLIEHGVLFVALAPALVGAFSTLQTVVAASSTIMAFLSANAATATAIMGPLAIAVVGATQAWAKYKQIVENTKAGVNDATQGWQDFFDTMVENGDTPTEILDAYKKKQDEVNKVVADAPFYLKAYIRGKMDDIDTTTMLRVAITATSDSYAEYKQAMIDAGVGAGFLTEEQYNNIKNSHDLGLELDQTGINLDNYTEQEQAAANAAAELAAKQDLYKQGLDELKYIMSGAVTNEFTSYNQKVQDAKDKLAEVNAKIDELEGKWYLTPDQQTQLDDLKQQQSDLTGSFDTMATEHEKATARIIFDIMQTKLAMTDLDPLLQLQALEEFASQTGLVDVATAELNTATNALASQTNEQNIGNLSNAMRILYKAIEDGHISADEMNLALDVLNGKKIYTEFFETHNITYIPQYQMSSPGGRGSQLVVAPETSDATLLASSQALGGDYLVTRPTLFVAGDNGDERVTFTPQNGIGEDMNDGGNTFITMINRDRSSAALAMAYVDLARNKKLNHEIGR
jgi:tape measure domain-containing protein